MVVGIIAAAVGAIVGAVVTHALHRRSVARDAARVELQGLQTEAASLRVGLRGLSERLQDTIDRLNSEEGTHHEA